LTADEALRHAWSLGESDADVHAAEQLLPWLLEAGYAETDDEAGIWGFTDRGIDRARELGLD
jgi:hypothetical protein